LVLIAFATLLVNRSFYSTMADRDTSHFSYDVRDAGLLGYAGVNGLAAFEGMVATFLLGIYAYTKNKTAKIGILLVVATCGYCLLFSFSRGGYVGFLAGVVTVGLFKARWLLVAVVVVFISWQTLLPASVKERITMTRADAAEGQEFDSSAQERIDLWQDAMELFKMNPLTGAGFQTYGYMGRVGDFRDTHNYYLKVLAETGVVGIVLYLVLLWRLFQSGTTLLFGTDDPFLRGIALGFMGLLVTVIVGDIFGDRWTYQQVDGYLWVILGLVLRGSAGFEEKPKETEGEAIEHAPVREEAELTAA
jgi:putative inorganic carbon (hco3(-)) transporter